MNEEIIKFGVWLTGHSEKDISQMLDDFSHGRDKSFPVDKPFKVNFADTLEKVIEYYNDMQTEVPDNLSLGRFHTNMIILIGEFEKYKSKISA